jgi:glycosyltransferase involved in cell wall biosynthesis
MASPTISVVIPLYNHAVYIEAALASVLRQTSPADEIILIDDGSTDDGAARAETALAGVPKARVIRQRNSGADATLNRLIEVAAGDFIAVLNSDDVFAPGKLARCREVIAREPGVGLICGRIGIIDENGMRQTSGITTDWLARAEAFRVRCGSPKLSLLHENYVATTSNMVFSRALWKACGGFQPLRYCHDLDFLMAAFRHGRVVLDLDAEHIQYRVHPENTIKERLDLIRLEIAAVLACALHDGIADLMPKGSTEPDFAPLAEMLKAKKVSHLLGMFSAMRAEVETRREFYGSIADKGTRERLIAALLQ